MCQGIGNLYDETTPNKDFKLSTPSHEIAITITIVSKIYSNNHILTKFSVDIVLR